MHHQSAVRKHVNLEMDSGLGSDEDRRGRTKEQKQLHNQQLLSGCFIDAASLSDDTERCCDERRQGALIFQSSIPQYSMLQMPMESDETATPYNSIVQLDLEPEASCKSPLGFYVDLSQVPDIAESPAPQASAAAKKNIFSMVIDFEGPKKDKPSKLSSRKKPLKSNLLINKSNGSLSSSVSSINSCVAGTSRQSDEIEVVKPQKLNLQVLSASLVKNLSLGSSTSSENVDEKKEDEVEVEEVLQEEVGEVQVQNVALVVHEQEDLDESSIKQKSASPPPSQQFVKLSDMECQKPRVELNYTPRMSRSIPESHWVESTLVMSRSAGYRSAPHPLEPELTESDSDSVTNLNSSLSRPRRSVQRLGTDLLRMFLEEIGPDVVVEVEGRKLKAHKCILASRCQYFAAMLSGHWLEASGNVISLQGFSYESVYFSLCHIYSGAAHVPDSISLVELASLSDMLGLEGLKEVVEHALKQRHCHNFHRPCAGCCTGVLEVLPLSAAYGLDDLYQKCLHWITQHFVRIWPSRAFASIPRELREKCYQQHVVHMTADTVLETILACEKVLTTLPSLRWAEPVSQLVLQLSDACHLYHRQHFAAVLAAPTFLALDTGMGWNVCQVEDQIVAAAKNLGVDQACRSYTRCCKMLDQNWSRPFNDLLNKIKLELEQCLVGQSDRLIRSNAWLRLDSALRARIKELSPAVEPTSRLPTRSKKPTKPPTNKTKSYIQSSLLSSSDSSRNSSPALNQSRVPISGGSPSLRRNLLLAARAPQVPASPATQRRTSTLTQPTAASAAKSHSAPSKNIKPKATSTIATTSRSLPNNRSVLNNNTTCKSAPAKKVVTVVRNQSTKKDKRPDSRSSSPMKSDSRLSSPRKFDSRVTSPIKSETSCKPSSPRKLPKAATSKVKEQQPVSTMTRSDTFLKEEPTVLSLRGNC